jgi:hypothetical protein
LKYRGSRPRGSKASTCAASSASPWSATPRSCFRHKRHRKHALSAEVERASGGVPCFRRTTELAVEYAYRYAAQYEGIWWLNSEEPGTLAADYAALGRKLSVERPQDQAEAIRTVRKALERRTGILLVFDNATDSDALEGYVPQRAQRRVLITSRAHYWPNAYCEAVDVLSTDEAAALLQEPDHGAPANTLPEVRSRAAARVAERLGRLPLALAQAWAYMQASGTSLESYEQLLEKHGLRLLEKGKASGARHTVATTWQLAVDRLAVECPAAVDLLSLCSFLAPNDIALSDLTNAAPRRATHVRPVRVTSDNVQASLSVRGQ